MSIICINHHKKHSNPKHHEDAIAYDAIPLPYIWRNIIRFRIQTLEHLNYTGKNRQNYYK